MQKRILCICLSLLLLTGCGRMNDTTQSVPTTTSTTVAIAQTTQATVTGTHTSTSAPTASVTSTVSTNKNTSSLPSHTTATHSTNEQTITTSATQTTTITQDATVTFKATVREDVHKNTVGGVLVIVYVDGSETPAASGTTNPQGVVTLPLQRGKNYRVVLDCLPSGYESNAYYSFSTTTVNIMIRKASVQNEKDHSNARYEEGRKMTDFTLTDIDGQTHQLSALCAQKQLIVLDFWFTTCEPCKLEFPYFESALNKYGDRFTLLAINPINDNKAMLSLRQQLNISPKTAVSFPMLRDTCNLYLGFNVSNYPTTVFIDSSGVILDIHIGAYTSEAAFSAAVERYLH